jgi:hypothetical protein
MKTITATIAFALSASITTPTSAQVLDRGQQCAIQARAYHNCIDTLEMANARAYAEHRGRGYDEYTVRALDRYLPNPLWECRRSLDAMYELGCPMGKGMR